MNFEEEKKMIKAILIDHMGTLVYEQSEYLEKLMKECDENCPDYDSQTITKCWFEKHDELLKLYNGENYKTEYEIAKEAFDWVINEKGLLGDSSYYTDLLTEHWKNTPAFQDAYDFFEQCQLPIYILTNNDTDYVLESMKRLELKPQGIISSEMTRYYKPAKEAFEKALEIMELAPHEVMYIGDSLGKDIFSAKELGIQTCFIGKETVDDQSIQVVDSLLDVFQYIK